MKMRTMKKAVLASDAEESERFNTYAQIEGDPKDV
jgi:hypothetical protein